MTLSTGLARITIREAGKTVTKDWIGNNPSINDMALPEGNTFLYVSARQSFAYPIDVVVRAFSEIPVEEFFARQLSVSIVPTAKGYEDLKNEDSAEMTQKVIAKASFHVTVIDGLPFLVSEDEQFLRFPLGDTEYTRALFASSGLIKVAVSGMLESLRGMSMIDAGIFKAGGSYEANRLFFNSYCRNLVDACEWLNPQSDHLDAALFFNGGHNSREAQDAGLYAQSMRVQHNSGEPIEPALVWRSTRRFDFEREDAHATSSFNDDEHSQ